MIEKSLIEILEDNSELEKIHFKENHPPFKLINNSIINLYKDEDVNINTKFIFHNIIEKYLDKDIKHLFYENFKNGNNYEIVYKLIINNFELECDALVENNTIIVTLTIIDNDYTDKKAKKLKEEKKKELLKKIHKDTHNDEIIF